MYKMKTKSSIKKRFRLTGSGKIRRNSMGKRHNLGNKSRKQKNRLSQSRLVHSTRQPSILECLPYRSR